MSNTDLNLEVSKLNEWIPQILGEVPDIEYALDYVEINNFAIEVKNAIRGIKFGVRSDGQYERRKYIYMEGHPYTMGFISYEDPRDNPTRGEDHYVVYSLNIRNLKYADYSNQRHMAMSVNMSQGVKNAKRYLRAVPWGYPAIRNIEDIRIAWQQQREVIYNDYYESAQKGLGVNVHKKGLIAELFKLLDSDYMFLDAEVKEALINMKAKYDVYKEDMLKVIKVFFVYAYVKWDKETYVVINLGGTANRNTDWRQLPHETYTADTLPLELKGKVMSLNVLENKSYVDDVGYKVGDNMFYVLH